MIIRYPSYHVMYISMYIKPHQLKNHALGILCKVTRDAMNLRRNCVKTDRVQNMPVEFA